MDNISIGLNNIKVLCPNGHVLYEVVKGKTLYDRYGIRFQTKQCVNMNHRYPDRIVYFKHSRILACYQLTEKQTERITKKCNECLE